MRGDVSGATAVVATLLRGEASVTRWARSRNGDTFRFDAVPPGTWTLRVLDFEGRARVERGRGNVDVRANDVSRATLRIE